MQPSEIGGTQKEKEIHKMSELENLIDCIREAEMSMYPSITQEEAEKMKERIRELENQEENYDHIIIDPEDYDGGY